MPNNSARTSQKDTVRAAILKALTQRNPNKDHTATVNLVHGHLAPVLSEIEDATATELGGMGLRHGKASAFSLLLEQARAENNKTVIAWLMDVGFSKVFGDAHCARCHGHDDTIQHSPSHTVRGVDGCPACLSETSNA